MLVHDVSEEDGRIKIRLNMRRFLALAVALALLYIAAVLLRAYYPPDNTVIGFFYVAFDLLPFILLFSITILEAYLAVRKKRGQGYSLRGCCWYVDTEIDMEKPADNTEAV